MKFLLAKTPEIIQKSLKANNMQALYIDFHCHPIELKKAVKDFIEKESEQDNGVYITYNTLALNYIPVDMMLWLEADGDYPPSIHPFSEVFSDFYKQGFSTGDIFEIITYGVGTPGEFKLDNNYLVDDVIHYSIPEKNELLGGMLKAAMDEDKALKLTDDTKDLLSKVTDILCTKET